MRYKTINPTVANENWGEVITEVTKVTNEEKKNWMSIMLQINENAIANEQAGGLYESYGSQGPEAVPGMGAVSFPQVGRNAGELTAKGYKRGSGDFADRQLAMAMNIAAYTIGLDLVPVIPMEFPSMMFGYLDHVYAGRLDASKDAQGTSEIYVELSGDLSGYARGNYSGLVKGDKVFIGKVPVDGSAELEDNQKALYGTFLGSHRINANPIIRFEGAVTLTKNGTTGATRTYALSALDSSVAPATVLKLDAGVGQEFALIKGVEGNASATVLSASDEVDAGVKTSFIASDNKTVVGDLVSAVDMHIPEFSKPQASYDGTEAKTATRAVGEHGTQNIVSLRLFSTSVEAGTIEVLGEVTRTQLKDLSAYGQDGVGQLYKAAQNELTQTMNRDILDTLFRLGVDAHAKLKNAQGIDLNLFLGDPATDPTRNLSDFGLTEFVDLQGNDRSDSFNGVKVGEANNSGENSATRARKILTKILASSNIISNISRHGKGTFAVTNTQVATAIQDNKGFIINAGDNQTNLNGDNLYSIGKVSGGVEVYVDPKMGWNDTRVLVGRKGTEQDPGLKMFIYSLGESTETISETSMGYKMVVTSRYALVPAGFYPEANYITFGVNNDFGIAN